MLTFGDFVLVICNIGEFINRIEKAIKKERIAFNRNFVNYNIRNGVSTQQLAEIANDSQRIAFLEKSKIYLSASISFHCKYGRR